MGKCHLLAKKPLTPEKMKKLESMRSRPKKLPDWPGMMKELVSSRELKHVECNDRSAPVIPAANSKTKVSALREWFQENIKNCVSKTDFVQDAAAKPDKLDDIVDKVRDDLESAKQILPLEFRSKEALERENKLLLARVFNLQKELKDKQRSTEQGSGMVQPLIIKQEAGESEADQKERGLAAWSCSRVVAQKPVSRQVSVKKWAVQMFSVEHLSEEEEKENGEEEEEEDDEDESQENDVAMRMVEELKLKMMKLIAVRKGQTSILMELSKAQKKLKAEKKKFKILYTEVENLARLVRDVEDEGEQKRVHRKC